MGSSLSRFWEGGSKGNASGGWPLPLASASGLWQGDLLLEDSGFKDTMIQDSRIQRKGYW